MDNKDKLNGILDVVNNQDATSQDITIALDTWNEIKGNVTESIKPYVACLLSDRVHEMMIAQ